MGWWLDSGLSLSQMLLRLLTCWRCEREFKLLEEGDSESTSSCATVESLATLMDSFTCHCSLFTWSKSHACKTPINQTKQLRSLVFEVPLAVSPSYRSLHTHFGRHGRSHLKVGFAVTWIDLK